MSESMPRMGSNSDPVNPKRQPDNRGYFEKLKDPRWQRLRLLIMQRDDFTCRDCESKDKPLHIYHCLYERGNPWDTGAQFLMTVCEDCHDRRQELEGDAKRALGMIFSQLRPDALARFVASICGEASSESVDEPVVVEQFSIDYDADCRWFKAAMDHPEMRPIYDEVTGTAVDWKKAEGQKKE